MKSTHWFAGLVASAAIMLAPSAQAYSSLYIFGASLSDSGNNAVALGGTLPAGQFAGGGWFSTIPYASGTYSNGPVWATSFASSLGLSAAPSLKGGGNYAFGGAQTAAPGVETPDGFPYSLKRQTEFFLAAHGDVAPSGALYVLESGGNNAREALSAVLGGANPSIVIGATALQYAIDTGMLIDSLQAKGAQNIVVWNTPNLGLTPLAASYGPLGMSLASDLSASMNAALAAQLQGRSGVTQFNVFGLMTQAALNPAAFGLSNVTDACGSVLGCDASSYLFWDGIHPTARGHELLAAGMLGAVPEPASYLLLLAGLLMLAAAARRRSH